MYKSVPLTVIKDKEAEKAFEIYITKCLEFCWIQILENKDVNLEDTLKSLSKLLPYKYKQIQASKFIVTWPALVDKGNIVEDCDAVLDEKDILHAERLNKRQSESKATSKDNNDEIEDKTKHDEIVSHGSSKRASKGNDGQQSEADKTTGSNPKLTGVGKMEKTEPKQTGRDAPTARPDRQQAKPRTEMLETENASKESKTDNQKQRKHNSTGSAAVTGQTPNANQNNAKKALNF